MEARNKSRDSARFLAQLVGAKRIIIFIVQILCVIYENPKSFYILPRYPDQADCS